MARLLRGRGAALLVGAVLLAAGPLRAADLGVGWLLVASQKARDPGFAKTVILLVQYDRDGVVGLVLNRRSDMPMSKAFPTVKEAQSSTDPVFLGGPVGLGVLALLRAPFKAGSDMIRVLPDVQMISSKESLERNFASKTPPATFRVYVGYSGWTTSQLQGEMDADQWYALRGNGATAFDPHPDTLWSRLVLKAQQVVAMR